MLSFLNLIVITTLCVHLYKFGLIKSIYFYTLYINSKIKNGVYWYWKKKCYKTKERVLWWIGKVF